MPRKLSLHRVPRVLAISVFTDRAHTLARKKKIGLGERVRVHYLPGNDGLDHPNYVDGTVREIDANLRSIRLTDAMTYIETPKPSDDITIDLNSPSLSHFELIATKRRPLAIRAAA